MVKAFHCLSSAVELEASRLDTYRLNTYRLDTYRLDTYRLDTYRLDTYRLDTYRQVSRAFYLVVGRGSAGQGTFLLGPRLERAD